ncbi:MAG: YIP1 family protein [Deltaproteobacteria bacterium]|nr:YIP1 family protein [Deltaproteobacteria bacterium]
MRSLRAIAGTIFDPVGTFRGLAEGPKTLLALLFVVLAQLSVPLALSGRLDTRAAAMNELGPKIGEMTDRDVSEAIQQKEKIASVIIVAKALVGPPLLALELTIVLWLWGRYLRGKPAFGVLYSLCTHAQIPFALRALGRTAVILGRTQIEPDEVDNLLPSGLAPLFHGSQPIAHALAGADLFLLWTAVLLGIALYAAGKLSVTRAVVGMTLAYAAFVAVFLVALPGLGGA